MVVAVAEAAAVEAVAAEAVEAEPPFLVSATMIGGASPMVAVAVAVAVAAVVLVATAGVRTTRPTDDHHYPRPTKTHHQRG